MITGATALLAILGDPIAHASSPALANARLEARGADARLVPWHVGAEDLPAAVAALRALRNLRGAIVTMPHKVAVVPLLDRLERDAERIGAANVVRRCPDGSLEGTNLDGRGFVAGLEASGHVLVGRRVHLMGAGGAATAIAFALAGRGVASLAIGNRDVNRARALAARVAAEFPRVVVRSAGRDASGADLVVNATSLGMTPDDPLPLDPDTLERGALVAEVIVTPNVTPLLAAARSRGNPTHPGRDMLVAQIEAMLDYMLTGGREDRRG